MTAQDFKPHGHAHGEHGHAHGEHGHAHGEHRSPHEFGFSPGGPGSNGAPLARGDGRGKVLFLQLQSGIAGDMTIAALLDLGVPASVVSDTVEALGFDDVNLVVRRGYAGAITCTHFDVQSSAHHPERSYADIVQLISTSSLDQAVKALALRIFERLGHAEAQVHGIPLASVHFHEVGAVDSIVDICGAAAAVCYLGAQVCASPVAVGTGFVECRHGVLPLPAPATALCLLGVPTVPSGLSTELVTPTGAAILSTLTTEFADWPAMVPERVGYGAGTKRLVDRPNVVRAILGTKHEQASDSTHVLLEANLDDMSGEWAAHALARVMQAGALDVWIVPATMKKGRPGMIFCALTESAAASQVAQIILRETTSLGVRQTLVSRVELPRQMLSVDTEFGSVRIKVRDAQQGELPRFKPEMDDCIRIAQVTGLPLPEVVARVTAAVAARWSAPDT